MSVLAWLFIFDIVIAAITFYIALRYLRVWWTYIISGEMVLSVGLVILIALFGNEEVPADVWPYMLAITQGGALILLLFCLVRVPLALTYTAASTLALLLGVYSGDVFYGGLGFVAFFSVIKAGFVGVYWYGICPKRSHCSFDRLHIWQD